NVVVTLGCDGATWFSNLGSVASADGSASVQATAPHPCHVGEDSPAANGETLSWNGDTISPNGTSSSVKRVSTSVHVLISTSLSSVSVRRGAGRHGDGIGRRDPQRLGAEHPGHGAGGPVLHAVAGGRLPQVDDAVHVLDELRVRAARQRDVERLSLF